MPTAFAKLCRMRGIGFGGGWLEGIGMIHLKPATECSNVFSSILPLIQFESFSQNAKLLFPVS
jgi:hypothetical protein